MSRYGRMSYATYQKHWHLDSDSKRAPIPHLIWNDGHAEWSRWYWFVKDEVCRCANPYYHFKNN